MEQFTFSFERTHTSELPSELLALVEQAKEAARGAYAPYSNFYVGVAVLMFDGSIRTAANHENASYPAGICAERAALANINPLIEANRITAIAVTTLDNGTEMVPLSPCGICRQTILEQQLAQGHPIAIYMCSPNGNIIVVKDASSILPFYFSNKNLLATAS